MDRAGRHVVARARSGVAGAGRRVLGIGDAPGARRWAAASLINALGTGLLLPLSVLYFTIHVGLSGASVGLGLTLGGVIALVFVPAGGILVDRFGARPVLLAGWLLAAAAYAAFGAVADWPEFLVAITAAEVAAAVGATAGKAFITELVPPPDRVR